MGISPSNVCCAILNGGRARRMGGANKAELPWDGEAILDRQLDVLRQRIDTVALVGGRGCARPGVVLLDDSVGGLGPVDGLLAALDWAPTSWLFLLASDMPTLSVDLIDLLLEKVVPGAAMVGVQVAEQGQPFFALYSKGLRSELADHVHAGNRRATAIWAHSWRTGSVKLISEVEARTVDPDLSSFRNLNRPEDLIRQTDTLE